MSLVEGMVFQYLAEYREQANSERFILPEKEEIELFSNVIKKSVEFFRKSGGDENFNQKIKVRTPNKISNT